VVVSMFHSISIDEVGKRNKELMKYAKPLLNQGGGDSG
jgi:hypothetical protein